MPPRFACAWVTAMVVCSDGLTRHVDDEILADVLSRDGADAHTICRELVSLAIEGGGTDNVAVVAALTG